MSEKILAHSTSSSIEQPSKQNEKNQKKRTNLKTLFHKYFARKSLGSGTVVPDLPETIKAPEAEKPKTYLQELGEKPLVSLDKMFDLPEDQNESFGVTAELVANNRLDEDTETKLKTKHLDGNLIGIGTASLFSMLEAFKTCESFTSIDVHPTPVAIGRSLEDLFREHENFADFFKVLSSETQMESLLKSKGLPDKYLRSALKSIEDAVHQYNLSKSNMAAFRQEGMHVKNMDLRNLFPLGAIQEHYEELKKMARAGNLNFIQADFFWPGFWEELEAHVPQLSAAQNLIYMSNGLDHVSRSKAILWDKWLQEGKKQYVEAEEHAITETATSNFKAWKNSTFVFTLTSLHYYLKMSDAPPKFAFEDHDLVFKDVRTCEENTSC